MDKNPKRPGLISKLIWMFIQSRSDFIYSVLSQENNNFSREGGYLNIICQT